MSNNSYFIILLDAIQQVEGARGFRDEKISSCTDNDCEDERLEEIITVIEEYLLDKFISKLRSTSRSITESEDPIIVPNTSVDAFFSVKNT